MIEPNLVCVEDKSVEQVWDPSMATHTLSTIAAELHTTSKSDRIPSCIVLVDNRRNEAMTLSNIRRQGLDSMKN